VVAAAPRPLLLAEEPELLGLSNLVPRAPRARRSDVLHRGARETGALSDRVLVLLVRLLHAEAERGGQPPEGQAVVDRARVVEGIDVAARCALGHLPQ